MQPTTQTQVMHAVQSVFIQARGKIDGLLKKRRELLENAQNAQNQAMILQIQNRIQQL